MSVGPNSRFVLPDSDGDVALDQRAGSLRYRVATAAEPLLIRPNALAGAAGGGGRRARQPPHHRGLRQGRPGAGRHPGRPASDPDERWPVGARRWRGWVQLAVRLAPGAELQPVELVIVPAIQPKLAPAEMPTTSAPARAPTAAPPASPLSATAATPSAGRPVQGAPTVLHPAPEARPQLAADVVEAPPCATPQTTRALHATRRARR